MRCEVSERRGFTGYTAGMGGATRTQGEAQAKVSDTNVSDQLHTTGGRAGGYSPTSTEVLHKGHSFLLVSHVSTQPARTTTQPR